MDVGFVGLGRMGLIMVRRSLRGGHRPVGYALDTAPVLTLSLQRRFASRQSESFAAKVVAALRNQFGGHAVKKA